jgi:pilus assembly protein CpaE
VRELLSAACHSILSGQNERRRTPTGSLILVIGVRGGVGATSIATRLAWRLAEAPPRPVLLLDLDLKGGDAALQLDATPNQALKQALSDVERVDDLFLERGAIHVTKRLDLMASLDALEDTTPLNEDAVLGLLNRLLRRYRYVVTDLSPAQASQLPRVLKSPATVLLVSDGRLVSARDVRRWRETLGPNDAHRSTLHILNRNGAPGTLTTDDFDRAAGHAADVIIPETREIGEATNLGVRAHPDCAPLTRGLSLVFERISGETVRGAPTFLERLFA